MHNLYNKGRHEEAKSVYNELKNYVDAKRAAFIGDFKFCKGASTEFFLSSTASIYANKNEPARVYGWAISHRQFVNMSAIFWK